MSGQTARLVRIGALLVAGAVLYDIAFDVFVMRTSTIREQVSTLFLLAAIGAYALAYHGVPRYTGDMDLLVRSNPENAGRVLRALEAIGES